MLPRKGAFVVLSIDPSASLEDCDGEDIAVLCKQLTNKKYVAYVDDVSGHSHFASGAYIINFLSPIPISITRSLRIIPTIST